MARILVVDDDAATREGLAEGLAGMGHEVSVASGGLAALQSLKDPLPDLILLDVMMPELNGLAACKALKDSGLPAASIPVVLMSARPLRAPERQELCRRHRAAAYLSKPFDLGLVAECIADTLAAAAAAPGRTS